MIHGPSTLTDARRLYGKIGSIPMIMGLFWGITDCAEVRAQIIQAVDDYNSGQQNIITFRIKSYSAATHSLSDLECRLRGLTLRGEQTPYNSQLQSVSNLICYGFTGWIEPAGGVWQGKPFNRNNLWEYDSALAFIRVQPPAEEVFLLHGTLRRKILGGTITTLQFKSVQITPLKDVWSQVMFAGRP